jgi:hypothetical protein
MFHRFALAAVLAATLSVPAHAQRPTPPEGPLVSGFLCCNLRTSGSKISDINYAEQGTRMIAAGTPLRITGYDRRWVSVDLAGTSQRIMNDYSRDLAPIPFAQRYVVSEDPKQKMAAYPQKTREAIQASKVIPGMTREQVAMAMGYPVTSENPDLNAPVWRFWLDSWTEFQVAFDASGAVKAVTADPATLARVTTPSP